MIWLRKGFVHFLSVVLLACLLSVAMATGFSQAFSHPAKLEGWLADSKIYDHLVAVALDQSQKSSNNDGSSGTVSLSDPTVKQAAEKTFSPQLLQQSVNTFLDSNYAWLSGKTAKPGFSIDLASAKQSFATEVGQNAQAHLAALPVCTTAQLAQIPIPFDSLAANCRPATLDPKAEGARVTQEINNSSDFLNNPVLTADSLNQEKNSAPSQPYYQKQPRAPKLYRLGLKLPWILGGVALLSILGIVFIAPERRRGLRRTGIVLAEVGVLLIATKFVADSLLNRLQNKLTDGHNTLASQLKQPVGELVHRIGAQLVKPDLWFGIAYLLLAILIFFFLFKSRQKTGKPKPFKSHLSDTEAPPTDTTGIRLARRRPSTDDSAVGLKLTSPAPKPTTAPPLGKNPPRPKRPRLIQ